MICMLLPRCDPVISTSRGFIKSRGRETFVGIIPLLAEITSLGVSCSIFELIHHPYSLGSSLASRRV